MTEELQNNSLSNKAEKQIITDNVSLPPIPGKYRVMRRNGKVTSFDLDKIVVAMTKAFLSVEEVVLQHPQEYTMRLNH